MKYILITPAYNEGKYIQNTIECVINQTIKPAQWIIVSDNSTDNTDEIVKGYEKKTPYITFFRYNNTEKFRSNLGRVSKKVVACINEALGYIDPSIHYDYFGILDADVTFGRDYYEKLLKKFDQNPKLGLAGGFIYDVNGIEKTPCFANSNIVGGAVQFFKRTCWDEMGNFYPGGHHDYYAVLSCKKNGWLVKSFSDLEVLHHKNPKTRSKSMMKVFFYLGRMDYICGEIILYALARAITQIKRKPYVLGSMCRIFGFLWAAIIRTPKQVPESLREYLREEQIRKILPWNFKKA